MITRRNRGGCHIELVIVPKQFPGVDATFGFPGSLRAVPAHNEFLTHLPCRDMRIRDQNFRCWGSSGFRKALRVMASGRAETVVHGRTQNGPFANRLLQNGLQLAQTCVGSLTVGLIFCHEVILGKRICNPLTHASQPGQTVHIAGHKSDTGRP